MADVMHWQSLGLCLAMLIGAAVYDPHLVNSLIALFGSDLRIDQGLALRFPIALNLVSAAIVLWLAIGMREPCTMDTPARAHQRDKQLAEHRGCGGLDPANARCALCHHRGRADR